MGSLALPSSDLGTFTSKTPLQQAVHGFFSSISNDTTYKLYWFSLDQFILWCQANHIDVLGAVRGQVEPYLRELEVGGYEKAGIWKPYSESTISIRWGVVRSFYAYATSERLITWDPCVKIKPPKVDLAKQKCTFLPPTEFATLLKKAAAGKPMESALLALIGLRGLRISEACGLDISNLTESQGYRVIDYIGKGGVAHQHVLPVPAMVAINRAIDGRQVGPILLNNRGNRMTRSNATYMLRCLARAAGVDDDISPHSMRRSLITAALIMGEDIYDVQRMVGHAQPTTTQRYDRLKNDLNRDKVHNVSGFLTALAG